MALPRFGSLIDDLKRDHMHAQDLSSVLESLRRRLDEEGIPFAVIGSLAAREYGYVRHTEDIDLLTTPEGLDRIHARLVGRSLVLRGPGLRKSFREPERHVNVDVIAAGEHAGSEESPVVYPDPRSDSFTERGGLRYPTLVSLIEFKIASGEWGHRGQDHVDVQKLIQANGLAEPFAASLPPQLRNRYLSLLKESRLERKME